MSLQSRDLQIISVERDTGRQRGSASGRMRPRTVSARAKRRRRQQRRLSFGLIGICAALLIAICYQTNWFTEIPFARSKQTKIRNLKEAMADKEEMANYPAELSELLDLNEETYEFVKDYPNREDYMGQAIDLSKDYTMGQIPLLMQWDKRWGYDMYGGAMIGIAGCGPTCMTMAYLYFKGDTDMNPRKMAEFAQEQGYHSADGTSWEFWTSGADKLGLAGEEISLNENTMKSVLDCGGLIVCSMAPGDFTTGGHYILLRGYDENGFFVNDPNRKSNSEKQWDFETLSSQIKNLWGIYDMPGTNKN